MDESLTQAKGEIYIHHFWGRYFFLPGEPNEGQERKRASFPTRPRFACTAQDMRGA